MENIFDHSNFDFGKKEYQHIYLGEKIDSCQTQANCKLIKLFLQIQTVMLLGPVFDEENDRIILSLFLSIQNIIDYKFGLENI